MLQYLILNNHLQSAKAYKHQSSFTWKQILVSSFTKGNREQFFSVFELLQKQQKLEFYLRVYFLIYSIHPFINVNARANSIPEKQIASFREFLDTKGADLAKTSEFLQFYALPFIKKPLEHGTFKTLFSKGWVGNLKQKLMAYIGIEEESMKSAVQGYFSSNQIQQAKKTKKQEAPITTKPIQSTSLSMAPKQQTGYEQKLRKVEQTNKQLFSQLQTIKQSYRHLLQNHQQMIEDSQQYIMESQTKWFQSYKELVKTSRVLLEIVGSFTFDNPKIERKYIQSKRKIEKYERFVSKKLDDLLSISQDISVFDKPSQNQISQYTMKSGYTSKSWVNNNMGEKNVVNYSQLQSINYTQNKNNITSYVEIDEYIGINFTKLNQEFNRMSQSEKVEIIQGFTWRLLKSKSAGIRRFYCISLIANNFMGLGKVDVKSKNGDLQMCVRYLGDNMVGDSLLQLLNYMKVDYYSRQWLFLSHNICYPLMQTMSQHLLSNNVQSFMISLDILSTISAYKDYRQSIISTELPIFLLNVLQSYPKLFQSQQLMQLIMMIFMNVSAFPEGLELLAQYENIFSTLSVAFEHEYHDIIMLVNGFYYTLLSSKTLYDLAIESNMPEFVKFLLSSPQYKQHQRQLTFIQSRLEKYQDNNQQKKNINNQSKPNKQGKNSPNKSPYQHQQQELFLVDSQNQYDEIEIFQQADQRQNLSQYIKAHQALTIKYPLTEAQAQQQQKQIQSINLGFIKKTQLNKLQQNDKKLQLKQQGNQHQNNNNQSQTENELNKPQVKKIPEQSKLKKPTIVTLKSQQSQLSIIDLSNKNNLNSNINNKKKNQPQQPTIKQQIFSTPPPKIDAFIEIEQPIPKNTKEEQFMGILSKQRNPTFAKQKTQPIQKYSTPIVPHSENLELPNFGSYSPPGQLGPEQKTRRKQILKQLNEQIQSKQKQKVEKHKSKLEFDKVIEQDKEEAFSKKRQPIGSEIENGPKVVRGNAHIKKEEPVNQKPVKQKQQQRKAFVSRPKIHRTPPKEEDL